MHVLATELATLEEADVAVDLGQSPAEIVVLSFSDSDLSALAAAWQQDADALPTMRLASLKRLKHPMSVDLYVESVVAHARLVIVRCLGGLDYWRYGFERIADIAREHGILFAALPGDDRADPRLASVSTLPPDRWRRSTASSARAARRTCGRRCAMPARCSAATWPGRRRCRSARSPCSAVPTTGRPVALVVFYRANLMAADIAPVTALMEALDRQGLAPLAVAVNSLKDPLMRPELQALIADAQARGHPQHHGLLGEGARTTRRCSTPPTCRCCRSCCRAARARRGTSSQRGLSPADLAMNVVLPELDGRLLTRAISFKAEAHGRSAAGIRQRASRAGRRSRRLRGAARRGLGEACAARRVTSGASRSCCRTIPARGGRTGYAVGLDTAASAAEILRSAEAPKATTPADATGRPPTSSACWSARPSTSTFRSPPTRPGARRCRESAAPRLIETWGEPTDAFRLPVLRCGKVLVLLQPDRGSPAIASRATTTRAARRATPMSPPMPGCASARRSTRWSISARTARWNGCPARRWRCRPNAGPRSCWARCR